MPPDPGEVVARPLTVPTYERDQCFFHYTTRCAAFEHIIPSRQLRLSPFSQMRDPLEAKLPPVTLITGLGTNSPLDDQLAVMDELNALSARDPDPVRDRTKLLCLTVDRHEPEAAGPPTNYGAGWARARMWDQYAEHGKGVCLVFSRPVLTLEVMGRPTQYPRATHQEVRYTPTGLAGTEATVIKVPNNIAAMRETFPDRPLADLLWDVHFGQHKKELLFTKLQDWESEHEYRFVITADEDGPVFVNVTQSLVGVVVGHDFPAWQRAGVRTLCDTEDLGVSRINWQCASGPELVLLEPADELARRKERFWHGRHP